MARAGVRAKAGIVRLSCLPTLVMDGSEVSSSFAATIASAWSYVVYFLS
jgi:hypothetical protein